MCLETRLRRSKSTGDLGAATNSHCFDSRCAKCENSSSHNHNSYGEWQALLDSLNKSRKQILDLKNKNQKLRGVVKQQQCMLNTIKDDSKMSYRKAVAGFLEETMKSLDDIGHDFENTDDSEEVPNKQARSLLAAIEPKQSQTEKLTNKIENSSANKLANSLANKIIIDHQDRTIAEKGPKLLPKRTSTTRDVAVDSLKQGFCFAEEKRNVKYTDWTLQWWKSHDHKNDQFCDAMNPSLRSFNKELMNSPKTLPKDFMPPLEMAMNSPARTIRQDTPVGSDTDDFYAVELKLPPSPPQPVDPEVSVIDHLMHSAVINKKIAAGDVAGSFEEALSHCNLALVMVACRAVDPATVFSPCRLPQSVLLALVQQLATDMVHDTQLKCRYLEEALINLQVSDQVTRTHLPLVVGEVRKHLSKFVRAYPHHVANRRISLIIMAADNLIK